MWRFARKKAAKGAGKRAVGRAVGRAVAHTVLRTAEGVSASLSMFEGTGEPPLPISITWSLSSRPEISAVAASGELWATADANGVGCNTELDGEPCSLRVEEARRSAPSNVVPRFNSFSLVGRSSTGTSVADGVEIARPSSSITLGTIGVEELPPLPRREVPDSLLPRPRPILVNKPLTPGGCSGFTFRTCILL